MSHGAAVIAAEDAQPIERPSAAKSYYILFILMLVQAVSIFDRRIMNILVEPIRLELKLSDAQMGALTGLAFAIVYIILCIPAGRLADRWPRVTIISASLAIWSVATILCGAAQSGVQMFLARFGVGFGEAGGSTPAQALISDIFPRERRATAMGLFFIAVPLGGAAGLSIGGWAAQALGWRHAFLIAGIPGLILAPIMYLTFPRIRKGQSDRGTTSPHSEPFLVTLRRLWATRTLPLMIFGATLHTLVASGMDNWIPAFLERQHHLGAAAIGAGLGAATGLGSLIGHVSGGPLADWMGRRDMRWQLWIPTIAAPIAGALSALAFVGPVHWFFLLMGLQVLLGGLFSAPMVAIVMNLSPAHARATALACLFFVINGFGLGVGPWLIGQASDQFRAAGFGVQSLQAALLCATTAVIPASLLFFLAARHYRRDLATAEADAERSPA